MQQKQKLRWDILLILLVVMGTAWKVAVNSCQEINRLRQGEWSFEGRLRIQSWQETPEGVLLQGDNLWDNEETVLTVLLHPETDYCRQMTQRDLLDALQNSAEPVDIIIKCYYNPWETLWRKVIPVYLAGWPDEWPV